MATEEQTKTLEYVDGYTDEITDELTEYGGTAEAKVPEKEIKYDVDLENNENNIEFARGMANYSSAECRKIVGSHSNDIENILGYKNYDAVVTRDNITELI